MSEAAVATKEVAQIENKVFKYDHQFVPAQLALYSLSMERIAELKEQCMEYRVESIDDKAGYNQVYEALQILKKQRAQVKKDHGIIKAPFLDIGKAIDKKKNELSDGLAPIITHLESERKKYDNWVAEKKAEEERLHKEKIQNRVDSLSKYGAAINLELIEQLSDDNFQMLLSQEREKYELAEKQRLEREEAERLKKQILQNRMLRTILGTKLRDKVSTKSMLDELNILSINQMTCLSILMETWTNTA